MHRFVALSGSLNLQHSPQLPRLQKDLTESNKLFCKLESLRKWSFGTAVWGLGLLLQWFPARSGAGEQGLTRLSGLAFRRARTCVNSTRRVLVSARLRLFYGCRATRPVLGGMPSRCPHRTCEYMTVCVCVLFSAADAWCQFEAAFPCLRQRVLFGDIASCKLLEHTGRQRPGRYN